MICQRIKRTVVVDQRQFAKRGSRFPTTSVIDGPTEERRLLNAWSVKIPSLVIPDARSKEPSRGGRGVRIIGLNFCQPDCCESTEKSPRIGWHLVQQNATAGFQQESVAGFKEQVHQGVYTMVMLTDLPKTKALFVPVLR